MEFILIHRLIGPLPPEITKAAIEFAKKLLEKPGELVPGGKLIAAYGARCESLAVCIWDVPNAENLMLAFEQLSLLGWNTEVIPAEKMEVAIPKLEKALAEAAKK